MKEPKKRHRSRLLPLITVALVVSLGIAAIATARTTVRSAPAPGKVGMAALLAFDKQNITPKKKYRFAYLAECLSNPYCSQRLKGIQAAAKKYGMTFKTLDAEFNPATQVKLVQTAAADNSYDGFIFAPTAEVPGCSMWKKYLLPTGKPVVVTDIPMCNNRNHTPGTAATVIMQTADYYNSYVARAFAYCKGKPCDLAVIGGFVGSDLFGLLQQAVKRAQKLYPNVNVACNQPGNYDPRTAFKIIGDCLRAHSNLRVVVSGWDDMTRGAAQAIQAAGKKPGQVLVMTEGGTCDAVSKIKQGWYTDTVALTPYEESYYSVIALLRKLNTGKNTGFANEAYTPPVVALGGTIFINKANLSKWKCEY